MRGKFWLALVSVLLLLLGSAGCSEERTPNEAGSEGAVYDDEDSGADRENPARSSPLDSNESDSDSTGSGSTDSQSTDSQSTDSQSTDSQSTVPRVVFLGDSITAGYGLPEAEAYPTVVGELLRVRGNPVRIVNAGQSGDTTSGALRRLDWVLQETAACVVVQIGANDGLRGGDLERIESQLGQIVERIQKTDSELLLLGMRIPPSYGAAYSEGFAQIYERVGERTGVHFVPFFMSGVAGRPELNLEDGIHPNREGHKKLAEVVADALGGILANAKER